MPRFIENEGNLLRFKFLLYRFLYFKKKEFFVKRLLLLFKATNIIIIQYSNIVFFLFKKERLTKKAKTSFYNEVLK